MKPSVFIGPREQKLRELDREAWGFGSAEGTIGGIGAVQIVRVDVNEAGHRRYVRKYRANMKASSGAALYRNARDLDRNEQLGVSS